MHLRLSGNVKNRQSYKEGNYYLANENLNGFPYWKQDNGDNAIWFHKSWYEGWTVGNEDYLGQDYNGIIGPNDVTAWPSKTLGDYNYWHYSEWKHVEEDDIFFEDCKCNIHTFKKDTLILSLKTRHGISSSGTRSTRILYIFLSL